MTYRGQTGQRSDSLEAHHAWSAIGRPSWPASGVSSTKSPAVVDSQITIGKTAPDQPAHRQMLSPRHALREMDAAGSDGRCSIRRAGSCMPTRSHESCPAASPVRDPGAFPAGRRGWWRAARWRRVSLLQPHQRTGPRLLFDHLTPRWLMEELGHLTQPSSPSTRTRRCTGSPSWSPISNLP